MTKDGLTRDGRYRLTPWSRIKYGPLSTRLSNWRNRRALGRGKRDLPARAGDQVRSRTPVLRSRINPATGRQHSHDRESGRLSDQSLGRWAEQRQRDAQAAGRTRGRSR